MANREGSVVLVEVPGLDEQDRQLPTGARTIRCSLWCRAEGRAWWALVPHDARELMRATKAELGREGIPEGLIMIRVNPGTLPQTWRTT